MHKVNRAGTAAAVGLALAFILFFSAPGGAACPERIVSLAPSITRDLCLLGLDDELVGVTIFCREYAPNKEQIGTLLEPNIEKIFSLRPDIVMVTKEGNSPNSVHRLTRLGLRVVVVDGSDSFADICAGFVAIGRAVCREQAAASIVRCARHTVAAAKRRAQARPEPSVFWELGTSPVFTACRASFIHDIIEQAGGRNVFQDLGGRYSRVSREEVVRRDPDVIIIAAPNEDMRLEQGQWERFPRLKAVKNKRIFIMADKMFTEPSPLAFARAVERISEFIHENGERRSP